MSIFARLQSLLQSLTSKEKNIQKAEPLPVASEKNYSVKSEHPPLSSNPAKTKPADPVSFPESAQSRPSKLQKTTCKIERTTPCSGGKIKKRTGIPILAPDADLEQLMQEPRVPSEENKQKLSPHDKKTKNNTPSPKPHTAKNRHGIPILRESIDFDLVFDSKGRKENTEENFAALLEKSLGLKELDVLLHEKKQKSPSPPLSLKERLARYPVPEETLDLHGFSGIQANLKTEIFLEEAKGKGLFTVRIITGKGLHSDGPAILPGIVEQKILELKRKDLILAYQWENKSGKAHGSVRVYLKHFD